MATEHDLKIWPEFFNDVDSGKKPFEVRVNDRDYQEGDKLRLREWNPNTNEYTGRETIKFVTHVLKGGVFGLPDNLAVLGISMYSNSLDALKEFHNDVNNLRDRLREGRDYLMQVHPKDLTVEDALVAFGYNKNGY